MTVPLAYAFSTVHDSDILPLRVIPLLHTHSVPGPAGIHGTKMTEATPHIQRGETRPRGHVGSDGVWDLAALCVLGWAVSLSLSPSSVRWLPGG